MASDRGSVLRLQDTIMSSLYDVSPAIREVWELSRHTPGWPFRSYRVLVQGGPDEWGCYTVSVLGENAEPRFIHRSWFWYMDGAR